LLGLRCRFQRRSHHRFTHDLGGILGLGTPGVFVHDASEQGLIEAAPVNPDANRLVEPAGDFDQLRKLLVAPCALTDVAGVDAQLGQRLGAGRVLRQQFVSVEMKIADQRHVDVHLRQTFANFRHSGGGFAGIDRDAHQFRTGARQLRHLHRGGKYILGIGIGHRLDDHG
jgi:hypothetical protein